MVKHLLQRSGKCFVWQMFEYSQNSALHPCPRQRTTADGPPSDGWHRFTAFLRKCSISPSPRPDENRSRAGRLPRGFPRVSSWVGSGRATFLNHRWAHPHESDHTLRDGSFGVALSQALRARLRSHRPSGTFRNRLILRLVLPLGRNSKILSSGISSGRVVGRSSDVTMIRALLPDHLLTLARMHSEVLLEVESPPALSGVLDVLEPCYPVLRGTIRDQITGPLPSFRQILRLQRRPVTLPAGTAPYPKLSPLVGGRSWSSAPLQAARGGSAHPCGLRWIIRTGECSK
jgi:hypothetical protein